MNITELERALRQLRLGGMADVLDFRGARRISTAAASLPATVMREGKLVYES